MPGMTESRGIAGAYRLSELFFLSSSSVLAYNSPGFSPPAVLTLLLPFARFQHR